MERLLTQHPKIAEAVVVGEPHPRLGELAVMVVIPKSAGEPPALEELTAHLACCGLPKECLPERLVFAQSLPRTEWGKFNRVELRKWLAAHPPGAGG
jgi:acyl-coenzyme A synthetase/AMP-(fatty) acid ligase